MILSILMILKHFNDSEYSNNMDDISENIEKYNPNKKRKILIVLHNMTAGMINNKTLHPIVTELFIKRRKLNISIVFITKILFKSTKRIRLNTTHLLSLKTQNKRKPNCNKSFIRY